MKLRLRSLQSKETVRLEVPNECNLQQLKESLNLALSSSSSSDSLHFSLNGKDELLSSSLQDSLQALGITSGDLVYFSRNPHDFSRSQQTLQGVGATEINSEIPSSREIEISQELEVIGLNCPNQETSFQDSSVKETQSAGAIQVQEPSLEDSSVKDDPYHDLHLQDIENEELESVESMDMDAGSADMEVRRISEPCFLKRVLTEEEFGDDFSDSKLLFIAIHAVFLESGFVGFDSVSGLRVDLFHLLQEQPLMNYTTTVCYTLPELLVDDNVTDSVVLKFQTLGQFVNVYGSLSKSSSSVHKSRLDKCRFVPTIGSIWANWDKSDTVYDNDSYNENVVFELWKNVKDELALPLLIDLCEKTGLVLPACLMRLPADVKLKILESLRGIDIARIACLCKEMRYLSSNNDLWEQKFAEEFGSGTEPQQTINWKAKFVSSWENRKKRKRRSFVRPVPSNFVRDEPHRFIFPPPIGGGIVGGDYDQFPGLGIPVPLGMATRILPPHSRIMREMRRRCVTPNCNLGGFNT